MKQTPTASLIWNKGIVQLVETETGEVLPTEPLNELLNHRKFVAAYREARRLGYDMTRDIDRDGVFPPRIDKWTRVDTRFDPEQSYRIPSFYTRGYDKGCVYVHDRSSLLLIISYKVRAGQPEQWKLVSSDLKEVNVTTEDPEEVGARLRSFIEAHKVRAYLAKGE